MGHDEQVEIVVVGAGVAGLACARRLHAAGREVLVLERARGVGGRCATRRVDGQPIDHGVSFLHGSHPAFLEALRAVPAERLRWPLAHAGGGTPCQPRAFTPGQERWVFAEGLSAFPKHLAQGLRLRLETPVRSLVLEGEHLVAELGVGRVRARAALVCLALEQARALVTPLGAGDPQVRAAAALLRMVGSVPCLTVLAGYPLEGPRPDWALCYPDSSVLQLISHDSSKRAAPRWTTLVVQAQAGWSQRQLEAVGLDSWPRALLREAAAVAGAWIAEPAWSQPHRWRYARSDQGVELASPLLLPLSGGAQLGVAGESFAPGGGVEAAFVAGARLAERVLESGQF